MTGRRDFVPAMVATRAAFLTFDRARATYKLTAFDRRVLDAVVCALSSYSRLHDRVAITQVATWVFDVVAEDVTGRQRKKVQESLRKLAAADVITYIAAIGRPKLGESPRPTIGLPTRELTPGVGVCSVAPEGRETHPHSGEKRTPTLAGNAPPTGWHTGEVAGEVSGQSSSRAALVERALKLRDVWQNLDRSERTLSDDEVAKAICAMQIADDLADHLIDEAIGKAFDALKTGNEIGNLLGFVRVVARNQRPGFALANGRAS